MIDLKESMSQAGISNEIKSMVSDEKIFSGRICDKSELLCLSREKMGCRSYFISVFLSC